MPSTYSNSPFVSLKADQNCGRVNGSSTSKSFASLSGNTTPAVNGSSLHGHVNGHSNGVKHNSNGEDEFLRLDAPQQDLLLLHGPRQKYSLEKSRSIPELQGDREILVQVLAIGLNPVDWKGADYGFSQPSYPWVNGRDFAGIVVRAPRDSSRVKQGDVVFGPSTDYRDIRKAAYQEYVVTTDYNVTRIPQGVTVKEGAALGVAYVAAVTALGISFGVNFTSLQSAPAGPDLLRLTRTLDRSRVPQDIHNEIFNGIPIGERPIPGEWLAIWGANSMTGQIALQLAKHAGLKVACIADIAKGGARLSELGADFLVDKYDDKRAVEILKAVTGGKLRFGIDCNGKDTATSLQDALANSGPRGHLLGLAGLPKNIGPNVVHHQIPIKIFHEAQQVGEAISTWLEDLLVARSLKLPEVEIAEGGLAGINDALDCMRTGQIGGKRIVVPVGGEKSGAQSPSPNGVLPNGIGNSAVGSSVNDLSYADEMNSDPERVRFAYWVPNVSGGLVISKIKQNTKWDLKSNVKYARTAEQFGFEYALSQIRFMAGYGAENQHEPVSFSQALLMNTERLKVIAALLPGPWNPAVAAKQIASIDNYCDGRVCVNVVSGWFRAEFASIGQWWLDHAERYRRSKEFITCLKGIWTNEKFTFNGDFYQFHDYPLKPKPLNLPGRPYPEIFQGGNSDDAKENAASVSDYYFMNGNTLEGFQEQIAGVKERAKKNNREGQVGFALNAFVICRETEEEAIRVLQEIQGKADPEAVEGFRQQVQNAGSSTGNKSGMWANSKFEDLVQYNDGFKTKLIGTKEQIAERIVLLKSLGVNIILTAFLHYDEEIEAFGREVLPLVRELERQGRGKDEAHEISITGDVYRKNDGAPPVEQSKVLDVQAAESAVTLSQDASLVDKQAGHSNGDASRWAPASWREQNTAIKSFQSLRAPDSPKKLVRPPETQPQQFERLDQDAHHSFALAHSDDLFFSGLKQKSDLAQSLQATHEKTPASTDQAHGTLLSLHLSQVHGETRGNPSATGSALAQWDDPPDFKPTAVGQSNAEAEQESNYFDPARGVVRWAEPADPYDGGPRRDAVQITDQIRPRPAIDARHPVEAESGDGAGLAQWDDPPDFKAPTIQEGPAASESSEESWHEVQETDHDAAPTGWSQVDDDDGPPPGHFSSVTPVQAALETTATASKQKLADEQYHAEAPNVKEDYDTAPLNWSQVDDDGPPAGLSRVDQVYEHNTTKSRVLRFDGHESSAAETSNTYDVAPISWSQVDDEGPPSELLLRAAQQASADEAEHSVVDANVDLESKAIDASRPRDTPAQPSTAADTAQQSQATSLVHRHSTFAAGPERETRSSKPDAVESYPQEAAENTTSAASTPLKATRGLRPPSQGGSSSTVQSPAGSPSSSKRHSAVRKEHKEDFFRKLSTRLKK